MFTGTSLLGTVQVVIPVLIFVVSLVHLTM